MLLGSKSRMNVLLVNSYSLPFICSLCLFACLIVWLYRGGWFVLPVVVDLSKLSLQIRTLLTAFCYSFQGKFNSILQFDFSYTPLTQSEYGTVIDVLGYLAVLLGTQTYWFGYPAFCQLPWCGGGGLYCTVLYCVGCCQYLWGVGPLNDTTHAVHCTVTLYRDAVRWRCTVTLFFESRLVWFLNFFGDSKFCLKTI